MLQAAQSTAISAVKSYIFNKSPKKNPANAWKSMKFLTLIAICIWKLGANIE